MNAPSTASPPGPSLLRRAPALFREQTGQYLWIPFVFALLNFATQIVFRRILAPGEFGTLNTALGVLALVVVPVAALDLALLTFGQSPHDPRQPEKSETLRSAAVIGLNTFAWAWGIFALVALFLFLPFLELPRYSVQLFTILTVPLAIVAVLGGAQRRREGGLPLWLFMLMAAACGRIIFAWWLGPREPWAELGLLAYFFSGFILVSQTQRSPSADTDARLKACRALLDRDFLWYLAATFSVLLSLFLFSSADRLVAQKWFGSADNNNLGLVNWKAFDAYQTAGLLGRGLLWGTQPLLWIFFAHRSRLTRTRSSDLAYFWLYLGVLLAGAIALVYLAAPLSSLFCGSDFAETASLTTHFAVAMVPLGILQAFGFFALASRRYPECFVLGASGVAYFALLYFVGRQPQLMIAYMFGGALVSMMLVLLVGIVRWGRRQP